MKQKILVVDDDRAVVRLMRGYLEQAGYAVEVAYDGETAVTHLATSPPDLILLDLMLPGKDGWEITRLMRADGRWQHIPIIMLTARIEDTDKIVGLEIGADDYVTKPYNPREVVARVRARLRTFEQPLGELLQVGELEMNVGKRLVKVSGDEIELTASEFDLLHVLMENVGYVFTRGQLIRRGLGADYEGLDRTLDSHIRNLRKKVEPNPKKPTYIQTVYGVGYKLVGD